MNQPADQQTLRVKVLAICSTVVCVTALVCGTILIPRLEGNESWYTILLALLIPAGAFLLMALGWVLSMRKG